MNKPAKYFDLKQNGDNLYEILHSELYVHLAFPQLSRKMQNYIAERGDIEIIRCCTPSWKVKFYEEKMPEDGIWSICHNCTNIVEEYFHVEADNGEILQSVQDGHCGLLLPLLP